MTFSVPISLSCLVFVAGCVTDIYRYAPEQHFHVTGVGSVTNLPLPMHVHQQLQRLCLPGFQPQDADSTPKLWHLKPTLLQATKPGGKSIIF